jgi:tetratricopeptide (TPR) repeat protein
MAPFLSFAIPALFAVIADESSSTLPSPSPSSPLIRLEVCLSPGCVADGAQATLAKLQALAPPDKVEVLAGGCQSACGMGPVVLQETTAILNSTPKIIHKRMTAADSSNSITTDHNKDGALWRALLEEHSLEGDIHTDLVQGYELCQQAREALLAAKDFEKAVQLYELGIHLAMDYAKSNAAKAYSAPSDSDVKKRDAVPAQTLPSSANNGSGGTIHNNAVHPCIRWLVDAHCQLAQAHIHTKHLDAALSSAFTAVEISNETDPNCYELLASIYELQNVPQQELEALQHMFALIPDNYEALSPKVLPRDVSNRWRTLGFRKAKLEREVGMV